MNAPVTPAQSMAMRQVQLDDKYTLTHDLAWMSGIHALVRLPMNQRMRDLRAGLNTAGFISGYRGSPLGGYDQHLWKAGKYLSEHHVVFQPGLNEDLAATAVWGSQQTPLFRGAKYDGVFGLWYGKGPGVDRSGDVFKHANAAGTSPHGGVLVVAGDDHPAKSSTLPHQSDHILKACMIPVLFPATVQEILDFGAIGWALSRYAGVWVGMKCITDVVEASASVDVDPHRVTLTQPTDFELPADGLNIRLPDTPLAQEARLLDYKLYAALAFARANGLNRQLWSIPDEQARIGIVTSGKAYLDTRKALLDLGLDPQTCQRIGLRLFKVGMVWPLEASGLNTFAENLDEIIVVEEKRQILEYQVKEELFGWIGRGKKIPRVVGKFDDKDGGEWAVPQGNWLLPAHYEFSPAIVAQVIGQRLLKFDLPEDVRAAISARLTVIDAMQRARATPRIVTERKPWFCSGCPHNTSTRLPEGSRGLAGIGCHYMVTWMDRSTDVYTQMGGEGVPWIGQAPFTSENHVFANLGDGTYFHSGILAIRAAVAAKVNITYKILYNDAVAMTGGQPVDGQITVPMIASQVLAENVKRVVVVTDEPNKYEHSNLLPPGVSVFHRDQLDQVQRQCRETPEVTVLIYDQTCASEKRRRRKRNEYPDPPVRAVINERVCEGCGDCSKQSNCLSVEPLDTELGRKRTINQSSCNKDYSCIKGFCPSFVTVHGGALRKPAAVSASSVGLDDLPAPSTKILTQPYGIVIAGVGGTGVVTIGQLLGMAAHIEGKAGSVLDMAGLAQKGGAVYSHVLIASAGSDILNTRVAMGDADLLICGDLVVGTSAEAMARLHQGKTCTLLNTDVSPTAAFLSNPNWVVPTKSLEQLLETATGEDRLASVDASQLAQKLMGDMVYANPLMLGFAYQKGWIPLGHESIEQAIHLNGVQVQANITAFRWGRMSAHNLDVVLETLAPNKPMATPAADLSTLPALVAHRAEILRQYQNMSYAEKYQTFVDEVAKAEQQRCGSDQLAIAVARYLFKLMAYKDEYEVARLYTDGEFLRKLDQQFEGDWSLKFHLAPPLLAKRDDKGRLIKKAYGPSMLAAFKLLAKLRFLRATPLDPFGYTKERRQERALIEQYQAAIRALLPNLSPAELPNAIAVANIPDGVRGFGHIKEASMQDALDTLSGIAGGRATTLGASASPG